MSIGWLPPGAPPLSCRRAVVSKRPGPAQLPKCALAGHIGVLRTVKALRKGTRSWERAHSPYWSAHVEAWRRRGLSRTEYCRRHGLERLDADQLALGLEDVETEARAEAARRPRVRPGMESPDASRSPIICRANRSSQRRGLRLLWRRVASDRRERQRDAGLGAGVPRHLPRLELGGGVPASMRTFVVIPTMLGTFDSIAEQVHDLETRYLSSGPGELYFALLTDWPDAPHEQMPEDRAQLDDAARP